MLQLNPTKSGTVKAGKLSHKTTVLLPEVEALHQEWLNENWLESMNELTEAVDKKKKKAD